MPETAPITAEDPPSRFALSIVIPVYNGASSVGELVGALAEMAVAHPTAGSFGVYAEMYLNPWAGFTVRYTYWACQCVAIGGEAVAIAMYCQWWFPNTPAWMWVVFYSALLIFINARSVGAFGSFEYRFTSAAAYARSAAGALAASLNARCAVS